MWEFWDIILRYDLNKIINERDCKKRQRINELHEKRLNLFRKLLEPPSYPFLIKTCSKIMLRDAINKIDAEIAQLEREIAEDRYNKDNGKNFDKVFIDDAINYFENTGESKMDNKEELKKSLAEEEQRAKDSLANIEKMKKQLEELNKKDEQPTVSATGVYLENTMDKLYSLDDCYSITYQISSDNNIDYRIKKMNINNCFATKEQAEQEALRRKIQELIRRRAMEWNSNHDWRKNFKEKSEIFYDFSNKKLNIGRLDSYKSFGTICFDTEELAQKMIDELNNNFNKNELKVGFGVI